MPERFLVFIPAYNCEKQVPRVLNQLLDRQVAAMVTECTWSITAPPTAPKPPCKAGCRPTRRPRSACCATTRTMPGRHHKVAFQYAVQHNFDYLIVLHGDDQGDIRDVLPWYTAAATASMIAALAPVLCRKAASRLQHSACGGQLWL